MIGLSSPLGQVTGVAIIKRPQKKAIPMSTTGPSPTSTDSPNPSTDHAEIPSPPTTAEAPGKNPGSKGPGTIWFGSMMSVSEWFRRAVPKPEPQNKTTQLGVHFEEVGEMISAMMDGYVGRITERQLGDTLDQLDKLSMGLKDGTYPVDWSAIDRTDFLDALCDQIVTAIGVAHMLDLDIVGAFAEVDKSNWSKFDEHLMPVFDPETKKILKGPGYVKASLDKFT